MSLGPEDDPLCYFFSFLYKKAEKFPHIRIPETIIFEHNFARVWYYYEGDVLYRRSGKDVTDTNMIYHALCSRSPNKGKDTVVATYISYSDDATSYSPKAELDENRAFNHARTGKAWEDRSTPATSAAASALETAASFDVGEDCFMITYLTRPQLRNFLNQKGKGERGILQQFIPPRGSKNDTIKASWSPLVCIVQRRENVHDMNDTSIALYERTVVEKQYVSHVREVQAAPHSTGQIRDICNDIVAGMTASENHKQFSIARLVVYFKHGRRRLYATFCSFVRLRPLAHVPTQLAWKDPEDEEKAKHGRSIFHRVGGESIPVQYQFFRSTLLTNGTTSGGTPSEPPTPGLGIMGSNQLKPQGITPKQSLLLGRFQRLVTEVEMERQARSVAEVSDDEPTAPVPGVRARSALSRPRTRRLGGKLSPSP